jgi:flagellar biosynthetic protein FlhB
MSDAEQGKSEPATPYKLKRAREKGNVARGTDIGFLAALAGLALYLWFEGPILGIQIAASARRALTAAPNVLANSDEALILTGQVAGPVIRAVAALSACIFLTVLVLEFIQIGPVFSTEPLRPDFGRLDPSRGFKRVFSIRMALDTAKNVLKLAVYGALAWLVVSYARSVAIPSLTDAQGLAEAMRQMGQRLLAFFVAGATMFAILDQVIARQDFARRMRMSHSDIRREFRDREGDPRVKQRRQKLHREFAKLSQSLRNIRRADVLITNPTHYAVALRYDPGTMVAPKVVGRGSHGFASRMRRLAFVYGVVVIENRELARELHRLCQLDQIIPEKFYRPVADIYISIRSKKSI